MSCFEVKVLDPNINTIEVETCINGQVASVEIIQYDIASLEVTHCVALLPSDYETIVSGLVPVWNVLSGTGIHVSSENGIFTLNASGLQPSGNYSTVGHSHLSSDISNFNSSVSGLLPVKNILSGSGVEVSSNNGNFTVAVTGNFGLTSEEVDNRVNNLLVAGQNILLDYNDPENLLTISTVGLQPSGNYSLVGHSHNSADISDFTTAVSGLLPPAPSIPSVSGDGYIVSTFADNTYIISAVGLQPSGNYTLIGHGHNVSDILNFNNAVSGLIPSPTFTSLIGVSGLIVSRSGTDYTVSLNDPAIELADIIDLPVSAKTFLVTPSSNNFSALISDETGSGSLVFNTSPSFNGIPTVPTATSGTNTNQIASTSFVRTEISNLVDSSPSTLDTLNELAAALGDDPAFATTVTNLIASKVSKSGDVMTGTLQAPSGLFTDSIDIGGFWNRISSQGVDGLSIYSAAPINITSDNELHLTGLTSIQLSSYFNIEFNTPFGEVVSWNGNTLSVEGHTHTSSNITNFNSSVSGLLPVKNILSGQYVNISADAGNYTVNVSGLQPSGNYSTVGHSHSYTDITNFASGVDGALSTMLLGGNYINLSYNSTADTLTINATGLQPSGNYSLVEHSHIINDISGLQSALDNKQPSGSYASLSHNHSVSNITDFGSSVSGLLPVKQLVAGSNVSITAVDGTYTIQSTVSTPSGVLEASRQLVNYDISTDIVASVGISLEYIYIFNTGSENAGLILPTAVDNKSVYTLKNNTLGTVYLKTTGSETIDGYDSIGLNRRYSTISVISDGLNWIIV